MTASLLWNEQIQQGLEALKRSLSQGKTWGKSRNTRVVAVLALSLSVVFFHLYSASSIVPTVAEQVDHGLGDTALPIQSNTETDKSLSEASDLSATTESSRPKFEWETPKARCPTKDWLTGPRFGNIREGITPELAESMILGLEKSLLPNADDVKNRKAKDPLRPYFERLLNQTICLDNSRFVHAPASTDIDDDELVRIWSTRLVYLAIHFHQHKPAIPDALARHRGGDPNSESCSPQELLGKHDVGPFDYQCSDDTKYIVASLSGVGLGANMRGGASVAILSAMNVDRVVLFVNQGPEGTNINSPWPLASCDRLDQQCFFMPVSPCVLTHKQINDRWNMPKSDSRHFFKKQRKLPKGHTEHEVIQGVLLFEPGSATMKTRELLYRYANMFINALPSDDDRLPLLQKAADKILLQPGERKGYHYSLATEHIPHAAVFYFMRPNPEMVLALEAIQDQIIPNGLDSENAIGLPIRASDKCWRESECLSFKEHMQISNDLWLDHLNGKKPSGKVPLLFTTESQAMRSDQLNFTQNSTAQAQFEVQFDFITNTADKSPDTGKLKRRHRIKHNVTADEAMLGSISSIQAQFHARLSIGNCCSNFHILLADFLYEGCGATTQHSFLCLQEHPNPMYKICCGWHHDCKRRKATYIAMVKNGTIAADSWKTNKDREL